MSESEELPVILVSAADKATATALITDIINSELAKEGSGEGSSDSQIWLISNKYYTARVRLVADSDDAEAGEDAARAQAHVLHLGAAELSADTLRRRAARAPAAAVRLAPCRLPAPAALCAAAAELRYEPVPLPAGAAPSAPAAGPFPELCGMERVREALQAHPWPGLRLLAGARAPPRDEPEEPPASDDDDFEMTDELFAEAMGALNAARDLRQEALDEPERRLRTEQLLRTLAAAFGADIFEPCAPLP